MSKPQKLAPLGLVTTLAWLFASLSSSQAHARTIRTLEADDTTVTVIHTAVGYSTLLEFEAKPVSAVVGDQDSFKLEYVGNSITIKPLVPRAKSNLFIFTDSDRFNCQLVTGPPTDVDYIVRIRTKIKSYPVTVAGAPASPDREPNRENEEPSPVVTRAVHQSVSYNGFRLAIVAVAQERQRSNPRSATLIDFELSTKREPYIFQARAIGVKQGGKFVEMESLYLDRLELTPGVAPIHGKLALLSQDFKASSPITLVFAVPNLNDPRAAHCIEVGLGAIGHRKSSASTTARPAAQREKTDGKGK